MTDVEPTQAGTLADPNGSSPEAAPVAAGEASGPITTIPLEADEIRFLMDWLRSGPYPNSAYMAQATSLLRKVEQVAPLAMGPGAQIE